MTPTIFRRLILIWWVLPIVALAVAVSTDRYLLPDELVSYLDSQPSAETTVLGWIQLAIASAWSVAVVIASVGLFNFRRWSRALFLWANVIVIVISPVLGPTVSSGIVSAIWYLDALLTGGIIFSMYLPPIGPLLDANGLPLAAEDN